MICEVCQRVVAKFGFARAITFPKWIQRLGFSKREICHREEEEGRDIQPNRGYSLWQKRCSSPRTWTEYVSADASQKVRPFIGQKEAGTEQVSSQNWSPMRRVAEMLAAGHRNILTFEWTPELAGGKAKAAIMEMETRGLVKTTLSGVEPTVAFGRWLTELRLREDQPEAVRLAGQPTPIVRRTAPPAEPTSLRTGTRKRYFAHLSSDRYEAGMKMAARIKELVEANGGTMRLSVLKRSLHADRHPAAWEEAIRRPLEDG